MKTIGIYIGMMIVVTCVAMRVVEADELGCWPNNPRTDCGFSTITQQQCLDRGCCWMPVNDPTGSTPWCVNQTLGSPPPPWNPPSLPFNSTEVAMMTKYYLANLNVCCLDSNQGGTQKCENCGGVVAAPDYDTGPGGSYVYAWMRDSALSMRALMDTNNDTAMVEQLMKNYLNWVTTNQAAPDPNGIDIRIEPKFNLPSPGSVFTGGWCRPQTDGPGLRAATLSQFAQDQISQGQLDYVKSSVYPAIKFDLDWVAANWQASGCDLWEEITSTDFFWNRYTMRYGLTKGAAVAGAVGDSQSQSAFLAAASVIEATLQAHWNGQFVYESLNREQDSAVILAFNEGYLGDDVFPPTSKEVAGTIQTLTNLFEGMFYINGLDNQTQVPGVLYGRYQGDTYGANGAGPWILCTSALAQLVYDTGTYTLENGLPTAAAMTKWVQILGLSSNPSSSSEFAKACLSYADGVLLRIRYHVESPQVNFHLSEQFDPTTGAEQSATDLTWSYANTLKAMKARGILNNKLN